MHIPMLNHQCHIVLGRHVDLPLSNSQHRRKLMFKKSGQLYSISTISMAVITLLLTITTASGDELDFKWRDSVDLNRDGYREEISVRKVGNDGRFTLKIGSHQISGRLYGEIEGFTIVDINKADKYLEVAVYTPGDSEDHEYLIYWYNGRRIAEVGHLSRWPTFKGNGIVYEKSWMGFWTIMSKYVLASNHTLRNIPQPFYHVGITAGVKNGRSFAIRLKAQNRAAVVGNLIPGSKIELLVAKFTETRKGQSDTWFLIKSSSGLIGWASESDVYDNVTGLPMAD
jgi:hypothetical protein